VSLLVNRRLHTQVLCHAGCDYSYGIYITTPTPILFEDLLIGAYDIFNILDHFIAKLVSLSLIVANLVVHLLDYLVHKIEVFSYTTHGEARVLLELFAEIIEVDIHSLVSQTNFVHHNLTDLEDTLRSYHCVRFFIV